MTEIVTPLDILQIRDVPLPGGRGVERQFIYKDRVLSKQEVENLQSEVANLKSTMLWRLLIAEGKYHAQHRAIIEAAKEPDDEKKLATLKEAHAYHSVVVMLEQFVLNITKK